MVLQRRLEVPHGTITFIQALIDILQHLVIVGTRQPGKAQPIIGQGLRQLPLLLIEIRQVKTGRGDPETKPRLGRDQESRIKETKSLLVFILITINDTDIRQRLDQAFLIMRLPTQFERLLKIRQRAVTALQLSEKYPNIVAGLGNPLRVVKITSPGEGF